MNPLTAEQFYAARDNRTDSLAPTPAYQEAKCALVVDPAIAATMTSQVMAIVAANLLSRWCRDIEFVMPDSALIPSLHLRGQASLHQRIAMEVGQSDPFGRFVFVDRPSRGRIVLGIGNVPADWHMGADAWRATVAPGHVSLPSSELGNIPIGAMAAACLGVAQAFKDACGMLGRAGGPIELDLFSHRGDLLGHDGPNRLEAADLGRVLLVGAGAVGSGLLYFVHMTNLRGHWILVDHDLVEMHNLSRSPLLGIDHVGAAKVVGCEAYIADMAGVSAEAHQLELGAFLNSVPRAPNAWDIVLPEANEFGARLKIQNIVPPLMIHGTTGHDWDVSLGRHIPIREACLACLFPHDSRQPAFVCGTGTVPTAHGPETHAALPFISALASVMALSELMKLGLPDYPLTPNALYMQIAGTEPFLVSSKLFKRDNCLCTSQPGIVGAMNGATKYAVLSSSPPAI